MKTITIANRKKIQLYSILIMTTITLAVAIFGFAYLYKIKLQESQQDELLYKLKHAISMIEDHKR